MAVFRIMRSFPKLKDRKSPFLELLLSRNAVTSSAYASSVDIPAAARAIATLTNKGGSGEVPVVVQSSTPSEEPTGANQLSSLDGCLMDRILLLIRLSCASTQRTKIYLQTVAMLHSVSHLPQNIGSVFAAGGAPMLEQLRHPLSDMLVLTASNSHVSIKPLSAIEVRLGVTSAISYLTDMFTQTTSCFEIEASCILSSYSFIYRYCRTPLHHHRN